MSRVQLALNVADLEASVQFYSTLLQTEPHKRRPGYANFQVAEPPLKLVLIETTDDARGSGVSGALNHLGIEVETTGQVHESLDRLRAEGLATAEELDTTCCYAQQDKVWVHDPVGTPWEVYTITDDSPTNAQDMEFIGKMNDGACCTPSSQVRAVPETGAVPATATSCC